MTSYSSSASYRPLPLKQRTSSRDNRRDYSSETWFSVLGLIKVRELFITVDHFSIWRRHLAWAVSDGKDLRDYLTQRYASSMVFMSLLLGAELNVLFNSAGVTTDVRHALMNETATSLSYWAGISIIISAILTLLSLVSTFTAWTMVSAVSSANAHCVFRSSIGQYVAELPGRFIVASIYSFVLWLVMFFFLLLPVGHSSFVLLAVMAGLFVHTITAFSAFGRVIMHSGAMGSERIFEPQFEASLLPHSLHKNLLCKARANLANSTSITRQYLSKQRPLDRCVSEEELSAQFSERSSVVGGGVDGDDPPARRRTDSLVRFIDGIGTDGLPFNEPPTAESMKDPPRSGFIAGTNSGRSFGLGPSSAAGFTSGNEPHFVPKQTGPRPPRPHTTMTERGGDLTETVGSQARAPVTPFGGKEGGGAGDAMFEKWLTPSATSSGLQPANDVASPLVESWKILEPRSERRDERTRDTIPISTSRGQQSTSQRSCSPTASTFESSDNGNHYSEIEEETRNGSLRLLSEEEKFDLEYGTWYTNTNQGHQHQQPSSAPRRTDQSTAGDGSGTQNDTTTARRDNRTASGGSDVSHGDPELRGLLLAGEGDDDDYDASDASALPPPTAGRTRGKQLSYSSFDHNSDAANPKP